MSSYDENFGAFLSALTPLNFVLIPFVPYGMWTLENTAFNTKAMKIQYITFMLIMFSVFILVSLILLPFAYILAMFKKFKVIYVSYSKLQQA